MTVSRKLSLTMPESTRRRKLRIVFGNFARTFNLTLGGHPKFNGSTESSQATGPHTHVVLNADIWIRIMCELRGDTRTLSRCAATCWELRACVLPELYRSVHLDQQFASLRESLEHGTPDLRHHIRRLHVSTQPACYWVAVALRTHADESAGSLSTVTLPSLQELRFSWLRWLPQIPPLNAGLGTRLSSIVTLEIANTLVGAFGPLQRMAVSFPHLHTLRLYAVPHAHWPLYDYGLDIRMQAEEHPGTPVLNLREFFASTTGPYTSPRWVQAVNWSHVRCLGVDASMAHQFFEALRSAGASLRHLGIFQLPSDRASDLWSVPDLSALAAYKSQTLAFIRC
jgi:hypothetical protein